MEPVLQSGIYSTPKAPRPRWLADRGPAGGSLNRSAGSRNEAEHLTRVEVETRYTLFFINIVVMSTAWGKQSGRTLPGKSDKMGINAVVYKPRPTGRLCIMSRPVTSP